MEGLPCLSESNSGERWGAILAAHPARSPHDQQGGHEEHIRHAGQGYDPCGRVLEPLRHATAAGRNHRHAAAKRSWWGPQRLEGLSKSSPGGPYVLGMLGLVKAEGGDLDSGARDVEAEMKAHPDDDPWMVLGLAQEYSNKERFSDAEGLLNSYGGSSERVQQMRV